MKEIKKSAKEFISFCLKSAEAKQQNYRGKGICIRCERFFPLNKIKGEFEVSFKGETKISTLCQKCRKEVVEEMKRNIGELLTS